MDFQHIEATFGKLEYRSLSFSKGLNIIEAPNESGKSTLLAFLRVMLYGFPPRERSRHGRAPKAKPNIFAVR